MSPNFKLLWECIIVDRKSEDRKNNDRILKRQKRFMSDPVRDTFQDFCITARYFLMDFFSIIFKRPKIPLL